MEGFLKISTGKFELEMLKLEKGRLRSKRFILIFVKRPMRKADKTYSVRPSEGKVQQNNVKNSHIQRYLKKVSLPQEVANSQ